MKYFHWYKGLALIALACSFMAHGSTVDTISARKTLSNSPNTKVGNVTVSAGQTQNYQAPANLTLSGESTQITVENDGRVILTAGKSIRILAGTTVSHGGFLYASIEPNVKSGKHHKKEIRLVTVEEKLKIEEQASLAVACVLFSPFPARNKGTLHAGDAENGSFSSSTNELSAVSPEQQRKVAVDSRTLPEVTRKQILINCHPIPVAYTYRTESLMVLRL